MLQIDKLKLVLVDEDVKNEKLGEKIAWCREHKFGFQADALFMEYEAVRKLIQTIKLIVIDELLEV